ncbi:MAG: ABC transporter permease [Candidatus Krumholzibacteria bacterium]|nr:ABC transporter permease [Candidatus Krumholzibacteria bacterium]
MVEQSRVDEERLGREIWKENLLQALQVIRTHRMRSGLLILGVAIGVMTVLGMVTVLSGLGKRIQQDLLSANRPFLDISRYDPMQGDRDFEALMRRKKLTAEDAKAIQDQCPSIERVDFEVSPGEGMRVLRYKGRRTNLIQVVGTSQNFPYVFSLQVDEGRFLTDLDVARRRRAVILGFGPAKDLFPNMDPIGKWVRIGAYEYEVVGTLQSRRHFMGSISDNFAVVPYSTFEKDHSSKYDDYEIIATVKPEYTLDEAKDEITALLRARRKVAPAEESDFYITTSEAFRDMITNITKYIGLVLIVISSIGLMVGGIGVMNIMLISVTERTREVGVRMALGARRHDILQQFLIEAATLTGTGGFIGIVCGLVAARGVTHLVQFPYSLPVIWIIIAFVFSAGIGIIFGMYPANRASKMDPIVALRQE